MKFSEAILKGYELVGGAQCKNDYCLRDDNPEAPAAVCVMGAFHLAMWGHARGGRSTDEGEHLEHLSQQDKWGRSFEEAWGELPQILNDDGMPWEHIYGMAVAAGL